MRISHLLFANNNIIFCRALVEECDKVMKVLEDYEATRGRNLIRRKPPYFSARTRREKSNFKLNKSLGLKSSNTTRST